MCKCTPNVRTPFCGKPGCEAPAQEASTQSDHPPREILAELRWTHNRGDLAQIYLRHLAQRAADKIERLQALLQLETGALEQVCNDLDSARTIERLQADLLETQRELQREVGTRAARVAEIDVLRKRAAELELKLTQADNRESAFRRANDLLKAQMDAMEECIGVKDGQTFEERTEELIVTEVNHENFRRASNEPLIAGYSQEQMLAALANADPVFGPGQTETIRTFIHELPRHASRVPSTKPETVTVQVPVDWDKVRPINFRFAQPAWPQPPSADDLAAHDRVLYGTSYIRIDAGGIRTRIDPSTIMIAPQPSESQETPADCPTCGYKLDSIAHFELCGHGHVTRRHDGMLAKCGGPAICKVCAAEQAALREPQSGCQDGSEIL